MPKVKKIELSFVCDEDWNKMTPNDTGRHCSSCQKTVVDFASYTDAQIIAHYSQKKNEKTCGQFRNGQLENLNKGLALPEKRYKTSFIRPILASALLSTAACSQEEVHLKGAVRVENNPQIIQQDSVKNSQVQPDTLSSTTNEKFEPRKVTHVKSLKNTVADTINVQAVHETVIIHNVVEFPDRRNEHLGGVPAISYEELEIHKRGEVTVSAPKQKTNWFRRIFRKNK